MPSFPQLDGESEALFPRVRSLVQWGVMLEILRARAWVVLHWLRRVVALFGPVAEERIVFYQHHWYLPHLRRPRTFNEKICHRKLFKPVPGSEILADKYAVREFVAQRGYPEILIEVLLITRNPEEIDFASLPRQFVVKTTHASGWNMLVTNKDGISRDEIISKCNRWISSSYGDLHREFHYNRIEPAIVIEKYLVDNRHGIPIDYRFLVFHGKCHFIAVDYGLPGSVRRSMYNRNWEPQPFTLKFPQGVIEPRPAMLDKMLEIAEALAQDLDFVRVDLYAVNDSAIYFGEMTFTPSAGFCTFYPSVKWDYLLGSLW
jgi:hypothetical protein